MKYRIGFSLGYVLVFLACEGILFLLTGFERAGAWLGMVCSIVVLGLCLESVRKNAFRGGIFHLRAALGVVLTAFYVLQLIVGGIVAFLPLKWGLIAEIILLAACLLCGGGTLLGGQMIEDGELYRKNCEK